jgi:hypothetical protein
MLGKRYLGGGIMAALVMAASANAGAMQEAAAPAVSPTEASEEQLDEALKRFGYLAGLAQVCVAQEQKAALEREVLDLNASIARLLGVDRAFLFTASFGYGSTVDVATADCAEVLKNYEARVAKHRAAAGAAK